MATRGRRGDPKKKEPILQVGERIRELRLARGWTLRDLARHSRVSQGMLSKLESRSVNPSLSVIQRIAAAFDQTLGRFLGEDDQEAKHEVVVLAREDHRLAVNHATGYTREELSPALHGRGLEFIRSRIPSGSGPLVFPPHAPHVEELIYVAEGSLKVSIGGQAYTLKAGDSVFLKPSARHSYENLGPEACECFIIIDTHLAD
jgi:transcriptional regulator with XRE-family HTH domain